MAAEETVNVRVHTDEEWYPCLSIGEADQDETLAYQVPAALLDALKAAQEAERTAEQAIMEHIAAAYPDARDVADWVRDRRNAPRFDQAREAYEADHPDGPGWTHATGVTRLRYLDAAGYER